jgi:phage repressor protein C with HTH and peptisase S24 domain
MTGREQILEAIREHGAMKPSEIAPHVDISDQYVRELAPKMVGEDKLAKRKDGRYDLPENVDVKEVQVSGSEGEIVELQNVPELEAGAGNDLMKPVNGGLKLPKRYIREAYGVQPNRLCVLRVRGDSMRDTLRPGQRLMAARWEGEDLEDGVIYGLRGPLGFTVKRLRFGREEGQPVIWVWSDNEEYADHRHWLPLSDFEDEYDVIAKALEVGQKL